RPLLAASEVAPEQRGLVPRVRLEWIRRQRDAPPCRGSCVCLTRIWTRASLFQALQSPTLWPRPAVELRVPCCPRQHPWPELLLLRAAGLPLAIAQSWRRASPNRRASNTGRADCRSVERPARIPRTATLPCEDRRPRLQPCPGCQAWLQLDTGRPLLG